MTSRIIIGLALALLLGGCDRVLHAAVTYMERLAGIQTNVVVLSPTPITLGQRAVEFDTHGAAEVIGSDASVCLSLQGNIPLQHNTLTDAEFDRFLKGAQTQVAIRTASGATMTVTVKCPDQSWNRFGYIAKHDELVACMDVHGGKPPLSVGTKISRISVSSDRPLKVLGIYWESTNAWDIGANGS